MMGVIIAMSGSVFTVLFGWALDKYKRYSLSLKLMSFISTGLMAALLITSHNYGTLLLTGFLFGVFMIPFNPLGNSFAVEVTHPINPVLVNGLMLGNCYLWATLSTLFSSYFFSIGKSYITNICFVVVCVIGSISSLFVKEDLRRINAK
jgi:MFS family permease